MIIIFCLSFIEVFHLLSNLLNNRKRDFPSHPDFFRSYSLGNQHYVWRGQEGSLSENSVLGNGSKTLKIKSVEQTSLYPWLTYQVRSLVRDDINARNLAKWVDDGQADYTLTVRIPSFKVRSYGQYRSASQLYTATISIEFIVYDGKTNTEVWRSGPIYYEENYENANEESAIKSILEMAVRRCMDALQQRF